MTAAEILERASAAGVTLTAHAGELRYRGPREAVDELLPILREHKADLLDALTTRVTVAIPGKAAADMAVPADRVIDFCKEAKRRGLLVKYKLRGHQTISTVMAPPGQTPEQLKSKLVTEFGDRIAFEPVDDPLFELRERVKRFIAETPTDDDDSFEFAYTPANKARDLAEVETADEAKLREWEHHRTNCERLGPKPPINGELA